jgi:alpha-L-fucosidase
MNPANTLPTPLPRIDAFESLGFGLFMHFGLYSLLGRGEWVMNREKIAPETYNKLINDFRVPDFDGRALARNAKSAGMKYAVLTTRHHEGFSLYDTRGLSTFDAMHCPAKRDLVKDFIDGCRAEGIVPFLYHTTLDWQWEPDWMWSRRSEGPANFDKYLDYLHASVEILCSHYGPIGGLWFDGNWGHPKANWREDRLYSIIRKHQPEAMIINNTGIGAEGQTGHPELDAVTFERSLPKPIDRSGWPKHVAGEMCHTLNQHWGIGQNDINYIAPSEIISSLCMSRRAGANYLLNVGPEATGKISDYERELLKVVGRWTSLYGQAIYETRPLNSAHCQGRDFILRARDGRLFYFAFDIRIAGDDHVTLNAGLPGYRAIDSLGATIRSVKWLDNNESLPFTQSADGALTSIRLTGYPYGSHHVVRVAEIVTEKTA